MPRGTATQVRSALRQVQGKARQVLKSLAQEIRAKESELRRLRDDEAKLAALAGQRSAPTSRSKRGAPGKGAGRISWRAVLEKLPKQFKASHIRAVPMTKDRRSSEVFAAIARWIDAKMVKRKERGLYERVQQSQARKPKKPA
jgi:hypothetical protein